MKFEKNELAPRKPGMTIKTIRVRMGGEKIKIIIYYYNIIIIDVKGELILIDMTYIILYYVIFEDDECDTNVVEYTLLRTLLYINIYIYIYVWYGG